MALEPPWIPKFMGASVPFLKYHRSVHAIGSSYPNVLIENIADIY